MLSSHIRAKALEKVTVDIFIRALKKVVALIKIAEINEKERKRLIGVFQKAGLEIIPFSKIDQKIWSSKPQLTEFTENYIRESEAKGLQARDIIKRYLGYLKK